MELRNWTVSLGLAAVVLVVVLLVTSYTEVLSSAPAVDPAPSTVSEPVEEEEQVREFSVRVSDAGISPSEMVVNRGDEVVLRVRSLDGASYELLEPINGLVIPVVAGETTEVVFTASRAGVFELFVDGAASDIKTDLVVNN